MPNEFSVKPELDEAFPVIRDTWTCPVTGIAVPKRPEQNLLWRADMLKWAEEDREFQVDLATACSQSLLFFVNGFVFTRRVFEPGQDGEIVQASNKHVPMVTWAIQDEHIRKIEEAIDQGKSLLTDKSRDMGATWDHIAVYTHRLLFREHESHLLLSRKEDAVDLLDGLPKGYPYGAVADPGTLFGKVDYILSRLPEWMLPRLSRKKMHVVNLDNGTRLDGESANATAGSSDRRTSVFMDEMAKMLEGESIKRSTADVTACRLPCSTPNGAGTAYTKWRLSGQIDVFVLPWWEHPEKGAGRYVEQDDLGRWRIRSPWYDREAEKRSPREMAIEIDMDHIGSGDTFFEGNVIEEHKMLFARPAPRRLGINWKKSVPDAEVPSKIAKRDLQAIQKTGNGPLRLWASLIRGRLDQTKSYNLGIDISKGQGASNSVISIACNETREKVAEWADANTPPYELARIVTAMAVWVGGRDRLPLIIWENNGDPGFDFGNQLVRTYQYPKIYFAKQVGTLSGKRGKRYGWRSSREGKAEALGMLRRAYAHGGYINHSKEALEEALTYVVFSDGGIGPATMQEESASARATHGDRVIADMLNVVAFNDSPKMREDDRKVPSRSIGYRLQQFKKRNKEQQTKHQTKFDFRRQGAA